MFWDDQYRRNERVWGEEPSELAVAAVKYLQRHRPNDEILSILDIGCGYGRDAAYLLENLRCKVLGVDISEKAIDIASSAVRKRHEGNVRFQRANFAELREGKHDIAFASNLYQLLRKDEREEFQTMVGRTLKQNGVLFLSTLSVRDPEHQGKGIDISRESDSFLDRVYLHLCTREELMDDFGFLGIRELYEHEYREPHATGEVHHHISWILVAKLV